MASYWFEPQTVALEVGGRTMTLETGRMAKQAAGAVVVTYGETVVLVTAANGTPRPGIDFFPLTVDFVEKTSAAGKIPGGFFKREARLSDREVLVCRFIDRAIRPLFPEQYRDETQIVATVLSADGENSPDIPAFVGASAALSISPLPFEGPIAAVRVGRVENEFLVNPTAEQAAESDFDLIVGGSRGALVMVGRPQVRPCRGREADRSPGRARAEGRQAQAGAAAARGSVGAYVAGPREGGDAAGRGRADPRQARALRRDRRDREGGARRIRRRLSQRAGAARHTRRGRGKP
jgi:ribonuclease PH